ncbi:MAG: hypothetical protein QCH35_04735 [Methanomicrobiaceae archaeon]|nr:hypothetical protein [Methanomicrobiaceae archaeon]
MKGWMAVLLIVAMVSAASGHVPLPGGGNDHLEHALAVDDPTKSWVVYDRLDAGGTAKYYRFEMNEGEELRLSVFTPEQSAFSPGMVVMGPGIAPSGMVPPFVEVPDSAGAAVVPGQAPEQAEFEPFTPAAIYPGAAYSVIVPAAGIYYAAVFEPDEGGAFGLVVGFREEFSTTEFLLVPVAVLGIHQWEGQPLAVILVPVALTLIAGAGLLAIGLRREEIVLCCLFGWLAIGAALLYLGTAMMLLVQTAIALEKTGADPAAVLPLVYVLVSAILGTFAIRTGIARNGRASRRGGVFMVVIGLLGLLSWSGLLLGPVLALAAGVLGLVRPDGAAP